MWQFVAIPCLALASCVSFFWLFISPARTSFWALVISSSAALSVSAHVSWSLRDGLGPDAITTTGVRAFQHFMSGFGFPLLAWTFVVVLGSLRYWWSARQRPNNSFKPNPHRGGA